MYNVKKSKIASQYAISLNVHNHQQNDTYFTSYKYIYDIYLHNVAAIASKVQNPLIRNRSEIAWCYVSASSQMSRGISWVGLVAERFDNTYTERAPQRVHVCGCVLVCMCMLYAVCCA